MGTAAEYNAISQGLDSDTPTTTKFPETSAISQGRKKLSATIRQGTYKHLNFLLQRTQRIARELLTDPVISNIDTENMRKDKSVLEQYVKDANEGLNSAFANCKEQILKNFFTFSNRYSTKVADLTNEQKTVWNALQAHGYEQFESEENKLLNDIGNHYADEFEHYLDALSPADKETEKDLVYVYETYQENQDIMDRANYGFRFGNFFSK
ncbi:uncharacterized protein [Eurosta solidaginis]